jgi:hypothetical protein
MDTVERLSQHTTDVTERLYANVLEDVEIARGHLEDTMEAWLAGLHQLGAIFEQFVEKFVR